MTMTMTQSPPPVTPSATPSFGIYDVDPTIAAEWLKLNKANRNIRAPRIAQYAADMANGQWHDTGETIKFDTDGNMIDGQHRLTAIVTTGVTVRLPVLFGLPPEAKEYIDTGAARTAGDALRMRGEKAPLVLGAAARLGYLMDNGFKNIRVSHAAVFTYIEEHLGIRQAADAVYGHAHKYDAPPAVMAYCRYRFVNVDEQAGGEFMSKLAELNDLASDDPILRLAQRLRQAARNRESIDRQTLAITVMRTWNSWRRGQSMQRVLIAAPEAPMPVLV